MLSCDFETSHTQVDVLCLDFVKKSDYTVSAHNLAIEIVRLECLELHVSKVSIHFDVLFFNKLLEIRFIDIIGRRFQLTLTGITASKEISIYI